jgi:hypothetical protein
MLTDTDRSNVLQVFPCLIILSLQEWRKTAGFILLHEEGSNFYRLL